jgi:putative endonuclease
MKSGRENLVGYVKKFERQYYVYILTTSKNSVLYTGVTNDLIRRVYEHKHDLVKGFSKRYQVHKLVYYDFVEDILAAIEREKQIKSWNREKNRFNKCFQP